MRIIDTIYIDGAFVTPHGDEWFDLFNPATERVIGSVRLADAKDARDAIAAAKRAFPAFSRTSKRARIDMLKRMHAAERSGDVLAAQIWSNTAAQAIRGNAKLGFVYPEEGYPLYCDCVAILRETDLTGADLSGVDLSTTLLPKGLTAAQVQKKSA